MSDDRATDAALEARLDRRRRQLSQALGLGLLVGGLGWQREVAADFFGSRRKPLPPDRSIFRIEGDVAINGRTARPDALIGPGDVIETGKGASLIAVYRQEALIVREQTRLELAPASAAAAFFRLVNGAMLAVFARRDEPYRILTPTATIGIRGTGVYTVAAPDSTYLCTCYGTVEMAAADDATQREVVISRHHDSPRMILAASDASARIVPAGFKNHTDAELMLIESLVGREVPFDPAAYESPSDSGY